MVERDETQMQDQSTRSDDRPSSAPVRTQMPSGSDRRQSSTLLQDQAWIDDVFQYHPPTGEQPQQYDRIRTAARVFANVILETAPPCADRTAALRKLREVVMTINASIALNGRV